MKKSAFPILALMLAPIASGQDTSDSSFIENLQVYGNCAVSDSIDMFTDEVTHGLFCIQSNLTDKTQIGFAVYPLGMFGDHAQRAELRMRGIGPYLPYVSISKGLQFHMEDSIEVAIRVDRGELFTGEWDFGSNGDASCFPSLGAGPHCNLEFFQRLLIDVANGERIAIKVGAESGNVLLEGSYEAVADFLERLQDKIPTIILPIQD